MEVFLKLVNEYDRLNSKLDELYVEISELLDAEIEYNGIRCKVSNFDIGDKKAVLYSLNGEYLHSWGKYITISFKELVKLLEK